MRKTVEIDQAFFVAHHIGSADAMKGDVSAHSLNIKSHQLKSMSSRLA